MIIPGFQLELFTGVHVPGSPSQFKYQQLSQIREQLFPGCSIVNISSMDYLFLAILGSCFGLVGIVFTVTFFIFYCRSSSDDEEKDVEAQVEEETEEESSSKNEESFYVGYEDGLYSYLKIPGKESENISVASIRNISTSSSQSDSLYEEETATDSNVDDLESSGIFSNSSAADSDDRVSESSCDSLLDYGNEEKIVKKTNHDETIISLNLQELFQETKVFFVDETESSFNLETLFKESEPMMKKIVKLKTVSVDVGESELQRSFLNISTTSEDISQHLETIRTPLNMISHKPSQPATLLSLITRFSYFYCLGGEHF